MTIYFISIGCRIEGGDCKSVDDFNAYLKMIYAHYSLSIEERIRQEEIWAYYYKRPIELDEENLKYICALKVVSPLQISELSAYMTTYGSLANYYELQALPSWDLTTLKLVRPFVTTSTTWKSRCKEVVPSREFVFHLVPKDLFGKKKGKHLGGASSSLVRYQFKKKGVYSVAFVACKASNEPLFWYDRKRGIYGLFGYWGGYAMIEEVGKVEKFLLGDYQVALGQGLVLGHSFSLDKSQEVIPVMKASFQGMKPNVSFQRKDSFRGIACTFKENNYRLLLYVSLRKLDITLHKDGDGGCYIKTLATRGIAYTTSLLLEKKDSLEEKLWGLALIYQNPAHTFTWGVQCLDSRYSVPLKLGEGLDHACFFEGKKNMNLSLFTNGIWRNFHFFTEVASSQNKSISSLMGMMGSFGKKIDVACLLYHYPADFHSLYGHAFSRKGAYNRNKGGIYLSTQYKPIHSLSFRGYVELSHYFVKEKSLHHAPFNKEEMMFCAIYQPIRSRTFTLNCKVSRSPKNAKGSKLSLPRTEKEKKGKVTLKVTYPLRKKIVAYTQCQLSSLQKDNLCPSYGGGIKQFFHYKNQEIDFKGWLTFYHTKGYSTAIRLYSHSLRGGLSYPPYYGSGVVGGLLLRYRFTKNLRVGIELTLNRSLHSTTRGSQWKVAIKIGNS